MQLTFGKNQLYTIPIHISTGFVIHNVDDELAALNTDFAAASLASGLIRRRKIEEFSVKLSVTFDVY
ncbi:hypothetical protein MU1_29840 [Paenibacillus glycanilyticus]|uniref:Uncharacterized protein n=1 Tax=Paenibacillus glycanilyticus TaxID=126569 RepID=A0ABQ6GCI3_9BACL|nr:hypothetical protein MU1_29840 [Paenibacillus glycanilyticus]